MKETFFLEDDADGFGLLQGIPFIEKLEGRYFRQIVKISRRRDYGVGEVIIEEGECDSFLYILLAGEVKIVKQESVLARLNQIGDIFGEMGVIELLPRSATVLAVSPEVSCLVIDTSLLEIMEPADRAAVYKMLAETVSERLRAATEELIALKQLVMGQSPL